MEKVNFTFNNGREKMMSARDAALLSRLKKGAYLTRDMALQPAAVLVQKEQESQTEELADPTDDLDAMDKAALHALAKELGVQMHHMTGEVKAREAIREFRAKAD